MVLQQIRRKAARRRKGSVFGPESQVKKFYKDSKGKIYNITDMEAFQYKFGIDPKATDIMKAKVTPIRLVEIAEKDYTPAMRVLYGDKDSGSSKKKA